MNKKAASILFMLIATVVNLLIMAIYFILGFILLSLYMRSNPNAATVASIGLIVVFVLSLILSFYTYSKLVNFAVKRFNLEDKMDPLFGKSRYHKRME